MIIKLFLAFISLYLLYASMYFFSKKLKKRFNQHQADYKEATRDINHKINVWLGQVYALRTKENNQRNQQLSKNLYRQGETYITEKERIAEDFTIPIHDYTTVFFATDWHDRWIHDDRLALLKTSDRHLDQ